MSSFYAYATVKGTGDVSGNRSKITWSGIATGAAQQINGLSFSHERTIGELRDSEGRLQGFSRAEEATEQLDLEIVVRAGTLAGSLNSLIPPPDLCVITLSNCHDPAGQSNPTLLNGDWVYKSGWKVTLGEEEAKISCTVFRYPGCSKTVTQLTTVIS
jgi:hypothetical protein